MNLTFDCVRDVVRDTNVKFNPLEHFAMKWKPVNRNKMRLNKEIEHGFDSIKMQLALEFRLFKHVPFE